MLALNALLADDISASDDVHIILAHSWLSLVAKQAGSPTTVDQGEFSAF